MLGFVQNWFAPGGSPIGVDFGTDCLRMAQVERSEGEIRLAAAASLDVPSNVRNDIPARVAFFAEGLRELLSEGKFRGRRAVLTLPASLMYIQHLRMPRMEEEALKKALPWELRGKLPIDPSRALLRHVVAGEIYQDQDPKSEVIVMAARRDLIDHLLAAAAKARLDVVGMNIEPKAILDCFGRVYRRKSDCEATTCYLDIGCNASRAIIARGNQIVFARVIPVGGEHMSRAVADALKISLDDAKLLRARFAAQPSALETTTPTPSEESDRRSEPGFALLDATVVAAQRQPVAGPTCPSMPKTASTASVEPEVQRQRSVETACREPLAKLVEELSLCRRYYESTFPNRPVDRLIFLGGEARQRTTCQEVAARMGIPAQIGDPFLRMPRDEEEDGKTENGPDRRFPQPAWAVATGLSIGALNAELARK